MKGLFLFFSFLVISLVNGVLRSPTCNSSINVTNTRFNIFFQDFQEAFQAPNVRIGRSFYNFEALIGATMRVDLAELFFAMNTIADFASPLNRSLDDINANWTFVLEARGDAHQFNADHVWREAQSASVFYMLAERATSHTSSEAQKLYMQAVNNFRKAAAAQSNCSVLEIPYENNTTLPGLFCPAVGKAKANIISSGGFDGATMVMYEQIATQGLMERGYNVLFFDGPGQGNSLLTFFIRFVANTFGFCLVLLAGLVLS